MINSKIRSLRLFELNRIILYVSEIIEIEKKIASGQKKIEDLNREKEQWREEVKKQKEVTEVDNINKIIIQIELKIQSTDTNLNSLDEYNMELQELVNSACKYIFSSGKLGLTEEEIIPTFLEEYIYILTTQGLDITSIFEKKSDLIDLVYEIYGSDQRKLVCDIINNNRIPKHYLEYFV